MTIPDIKAYTKATQELLKPIALGPTDRLRVRITKDLDKFLVHGYQTRVLTQGTEEVIYELAPSLPDHRWVSRIPERRVAELGDKWNWYELAATDYAAQVIAALWPRDRIDFDDDARQVFDYLLLTVKAQEQTAEVYAEFRQELPSSEAKIGEIIDPLCRLNGSWPPKPTYEGALELHPDNPLAGYQQCGAWLSMRSEGYGLFMKQGTGKTACVVARVCNECGEFVAQGRPMRVLIVCPKSVRKNWHEEFCKFATRTGEVTVLRGLAIKRVNQMIEAFTPQPDTEYSVVVCGYETLERSWNIIRAIEWDLCVLDESHAIKSTYTKRFKRAMELRDICRRRLLLTGTPITNTPLDLYSQFEFMGRGWSGFTSWNEFKKFYGVYENRGGHDVLVAIQNLPLMQERMTRLSFQVSKADALPDLPDKVYDVVEVEMTEAQVVAYDTLSKQLALEVEGMLGNAEREGGAARALVVNNVLVKMLRLAQITSGFISWDPDYDPETGAKGSRHIEYFEPNPKLDALVAELREQMAGNDDSKTIVWACWVPDIKAIEVRLALEGIRAVTFYGATDDLERAEAERAFNHDRDCRVFVGNPAAGGMGLNLIGYPPGDGEAYATNVDREIYYSQGWSPTTRSQSEDRAHRRGTRVQVRVSDLCVPGTIDEMIRERVLTKIVRALEISDVRSILKAVLHGVERDDD